MTIDERQADVPRGSTVLDAAAALGIVIPTLCSEPGEPGFTSCMVCVVEEQTSGRLLPACSARAEAGMRVAVHSPRAAAARRTALELLLSEHVGDCEAPCRRTCPADLDIPLMLRQLIREDTAAAARTVFERIPFPGVLGRICPAPCEKACRRGRYDGSVNIRRMERFVGDAAVRLGAVARPRPATGSGKRVAVIGGGPAGLSAACCLGLRGHGCTVFDDAQRPGGGLRETVKESRLSCDVLEAETAVLTGLGIDLQARVRVGRDVPFSRLRGDFDAIVLATGRPDTEEMTAWGIACRAERVAVDRESLQTALDGVFAAGGAVRNSRLAAASVGDGRSAAVSVDQYLSGGIPRGATRRFGSIVKTLKPNEIERFAAGGHPLRRVPNGDAESAPTPLLPAEEESQRCLHCDCRKPETCALRAHAERYGAVRGSYAGERPDFERETGGQGVVYESGKCIRCGKCVRLSERAHARPGLAFVFRGFGVRVGVPFGKPLDEGLRGIAAACVEACPTGALAWETAEERGAT